ncbi:hypothetical protein JQX13_27085 [Archangium violaceum]|uniref:hypothetical protein n=1 Tax=Archangium violaceum TaxID=83451 RepID=UPI00193B6036|nr:hypothetical protein [Archangium violaceum]QRK13376.1 hypothetical protein JQX13_27085 [Archangium violaceum]
MNSWTVAPAHIFDGARILSNVGGPVALRADDWRGTLPPGETLLLPAALGSLEVQGPADVLMGYLPELQRDIRTPLEAMGYPPSRISALGFGEPGALGGR